MKNVIDVKSCLQMCRERRGAGPGAPGAGGAYAYAYAYAAPTQLLRNQCTYLYVVVVDTDMRDLAPAKKL